MQNITPSDYRMQWRFDCSHPSRALPLNEGKFFWRVSFNSYKLFNLILLYHSLLSFIEISYDIKELELKLI